MLRAPPAARLEGHLDHARRPHAQLRRQTNLCALPQHAVRLLEIHLPRPIGIHLVKQQVQLRAGGNPRGTSKLGHLEFYIPGQRSNFLGVHARKMADQCVRRSSDCCSHRIFIFCLSLPTDATARAWLNLPAAVQVVVSRA